MRKFIAALYVLLVLAIPTVVIANDKVTICHAAGQAGTTKYVTLTISRNAVFKEQGGHFYEHGTPRAGHEEDYLGPCKTTPTVTPRATPSVPASPTTSPVIPSPSPEPSATSTSEPTTPVTSVEPTTSATPKVMVPLLPDTAMGE